MPDNTKDIAPVAGLRFTVASRPQRRFSNTQTINILAAPSDFQPIQLPATGFVRKISLLFTAAYTAASGGAIVAGDAPFNLINGITLTDATGQPVFQPISGYNLYLLNKYFSSGIIDTNIPRAWGCPNLGPEFAFTVTGGTTGVATFRLDIDLEEDYNSGYGCIPNLDSNASLQLKISAAAITNAFTGTGATIGTLSVRVEQHYWAPVGATIGGQAVATQPTGFGDYVETRYETQVANAAAENTINVSNRGGLIRGILLVSRAAGVRTAFTAGANVGLILDNNPVDEGVPIESHYDLVRRTYGYIGTDLTTSYAPLTPGTLPGLDRGVQVWNFGSLSGGRDSWLSTRVGSQLQLKITPGASASAVEIITLLAQVKDPAAFYADSALS